VTLLDGVRVVELGTTITAPLAARLMADIGAEVIKVERPDGDPFRRHNGPPPNPYFEAYNRNKRSVVLDLALAADRDSFTGLLADADIFLDNVRPGVLPRLGVDLAGVRKRNPRLIHCSITGFGATGPYRDRPAFDAVSQASSGMTSLFVDPESPELTGPTISDNVTGMYACIAMLGALNARWRTGTGARLEVNMLEATMGFIGDQYTAAVKFGAPPELFARVAGSQSYVFTCADGLLLAIHLSSRDKFWDALLVAIDASGLGADARFGSREARVANYRALSAELAAYFRGAPRAAWIERLSAIDIPFAPVYSVLEALDDPQVQALGSVYRVDDGRGGSLTGIHPPLLVDGRRPREMVRAPALGEYAP